MSESAARPSSFGEALRLAAIITSFLVVLSFALTVQPVRANDCIDQGTLTHAELRNMLTAAGSTVADPRDATGSTATTWSATLVVPEELCEATVSFSSYVAPSGFLEPFEDQELFDSVTDTYAPGTYELTVDVGAPCAWQVDLYVGDVITELQPGVGHPGDRQIDVAYNVTGEVCEDEEPAELGSLTVVKETENGDDSFAFSINGSPTFFLAGGEMSANPGLAVGSYVISETISADQLEAGWSLTVVSCTPTGEGTVDVTAGTVTVQLDANDDVTCTFHNVLESEGTAGGNPPPATPQQPQLPDTSMDQPTVPLDMLAVALIAAAIVRQNVRARARN